MPVLTLFTHIGTIWPYIIVGPMCLIRKCVICVYMYTLCLLIVNFLFTVQCSEHVEWRAYRQHSLRLWWATTTFMLCLVYVRLLMLAMLRLLCCAVLCYFSFLNIDNAECAIWFFCFIYLCFVCIFICYAMMQDRFLLLLVYWFSLIYCYACLSWFFIAFACNLVYIFMVEKICALISLCYVCMSYL